MTDDVWPGLPLAAWEDSLATVHRWLQIVGKIRLELTPPVNHWWHVSLYVTARGLTTSPMPYGTRAFQIDFDFLDHELLVLTDDGERRVVPLGPRSVADFYSTLMAELQSLGIQVDIWTTPVEVEQRTAFEADHFHAAYDPLYVRRCWQILWQTQRVLQQFRAGFVGKASPVQFFWGSFDLAYTRFSGRPAPVHPGSPNVGRSVMREAYSHEVSSCGFWPGPGLGEPAFYAYAYPAPDGLDERVVLPDAAYYDPAFGEFLLPYEAVRNARSPDEALLAFAESTYQAVADAAHWDRAALERRKVRP